MHLRILCLVLCCNMTWEYSRIFQNHLFLGLNFYCWLVEFQMSPTVILHNWSFPPWNVLESEINYLIQQLNVYFPVDNFANSNSWNTYQDNIIGFVTFHFQKSKILSMFIYFRFDYVTFQYRKKSCIGFVNIKKLQLKC